MTGYDAKNLAADILDDYRSTPEERAQAERLLEQHDGAKSPGPREEATASLKTLRDEIGNRDHRVRRGSGEAMPAHVSLAWTNLYQELAHAEKRWRQVANVQFWLGILTVPLVLTAAGILALGPIDPSSPAVSIFLSLVVGASVTHSFLVLRIHQQARQAEERIVEKRVGLAFLRIAVEDYAGAPEFEQIMGAGTQMFLGHHAAPSRPLGPEDLPENLFSAGRNKT